MFHIVLRLWVLFKSWNQKQEIDLFYAKSRNKMLEKNCFPKKPNNTDESCSHLEIGFLWYGLYDGWRKFTVLIHHKKILSYYLGKI